MNDLISRQAAIKIVKRYLLDCHVEDADWHGNGIEYELKNLPHAQQWIPVSERLPEEEVNVLVTRKYGTKRYVETAELLCGEWLCDMDEYKINPKTHSKPIAWMPLPEPFKEVE